MGETTSTSNPSEYNTSGPWLRIPSRRGGIMGEIWKASWWVYFAGIRHLLRRG